MRLPHRSHTADLTTIMIYKHLWWQLSVYRSWVWWTEHNLNIFSKKEPIQLITLAVGLPWCHNKAIKGDSAQRWGLCSFVHMSSSVQCVCMCHSQLTLLTAIGASLTSVHLTPFEQWGKCCRATRDVCLTGPCWCSVTYTFSALFREKNHNKDDSDFHFNATKRHKRSSWLSLCLLSCQC